MNCPLLSIDTGYQTNFEKKPENLEIAGKPSIRVCVEQPESLTLSSSLVVDEQDEVGDVIPDAEHEYRLRLRMLEYHFRNQPGGE